MPDFFTVLGQQVTPALVRDVIQRANQVRWGAHLLRWRYFDVTHEGLTYRNDALVSTAAWHLLKRIYVDGDWPAGTTLAQLNVDVRVTVLDPQTEIYVYGYYRTAPPRLQWGFFNPATGIAVVYDTEADQIATVFKPTEGALFFQRQIFCVRIDREEWQV